MGVKAEVLAAVKEAEGLDLGRRKNPVLSDMAGVRDPRPHEPLLKHGYIEKMLSALFGVDPEPSAKLLGSMPGGPEAPVGYKELLRRTEEMLNSTNIAEWYPDYGRGIREAVGVANMAEAAGVFAVTSARNPTKQNLQDTYAVMTIAREHLAKHGSFDGLAKSLQRAKGGGLFKGPAFSSVLERFYKSGIYDRNAKTSTYASNVMAKALGEFFLFSVNDVHVAKAMGYINQSGSHEGDPSFNDINPKSVNKYRNATYVIAKIAQDLGVEPSQVQAGLWAYSKYRLSDDSGLVSDLNGSFEEAKQHSIEHLKALEALLDKTKPLTPDLSDRQSIGFSDPEGAAQGVKFDRETQLELEEVARKQKRPLVKPVQRERKKGPVRLSGDVFEERLRQVSGLSQTEAHSVRAVLDSVFATVAKLSGINPDSLYVERISDIRSPTVLDKKRAHKLTKGRDPLGQIRFSTNNKTGLVSPDLLKLTTPAFAAKIMAWANPKSDKWTQAGWEKFSKSFHRFLISKNAPSVIKGGYSQMRDSMAPTASEWQAAIILWEGANVSTPLHEIGHLFRRMLTGKDLEFVEAQFGVKDGDWGKNQGEAEERFARTWERYLRTGKVTNPNLKSHFDNFKKWLKSIYHRLAGSDLKYKVSPEMEKFFDNFLSGRSLEKVAEQPPDLAGLSQHEVDLFQLGEGELKGEEKLAQGVWARSREIEKLYREGRIRDLNGRPKATKFFDKIDGVARRFPRLERIRQVLISQVEDLHYLDVIEDITVGRDGLNISDSPAKGARMLRGVDGLSEVISNTWAKAIGFASGARNERGTRVSGKLTGAQSIDVNNYLFWRSVIKREGVLSKRFPDRDVSSFNPEVDGRPMDADRAKVLLSMQARRIGPEAAADLKAMERKVGSFWKWFLKYTQDSGLINADTVASIKAQNLEHGDYIGPFDVIAKAFDQLEKGEAAPRSMNVAVQDVVNPLMGTTKEIANLFESSIKKIFKSVHQAEQNKVVLNLYRLRKRSDIGKDLILEPRIIEGDVQPAPDGWSTMSAYEDGVKKDFYVPNEVAGVMKGLNRATMNWLLRSAAGQSALLRAGATSYSPTFAVGNFFRDFGTQYIRADFPLTPKDAELGFRAIATTFGGMTGKNKKNQRVYRDWLKSGGAFTSRISQFRGTVKAEALIHKGDLGDPFMDADGFQDRLSRFLRKAGRKVEKAAQVSEESTRVAAFMKTRKAMEEKGMSGQDALLEAGLASRVNSVDFAGGGKVLQVLNFLAPFVKARGRGFYTEIEGITRSKGHKKRAMFAFMGAGIAAATLSAWNRSEWGDDYDDLPDYIKQNYFVFQIGREAVPIEEDSRGYKEVIIKIPKPDWVKWIASPIEDMVSYMWGRDVGFGEALLGTIGAISPYDFEREGEFSVDLLISQFEPPVLRAILETQSNYDPFRGRNIVPLSLQGVAPSEQFNAYTTSTAREIGKKFGWSPMKIEHAFRTTLGSVGRGILQQGEWFFGTPEDRKDMSFAQKAGRMPIISALFSVTGGAHRSRLFQIASDVQIETATSDLLKKRPVRLALDRWSKWSPERRRKFLSEAPEILGEPRGREIFLNEVKRMVKGVGKNPIIDRVRRMSQGRGRYLFIKRVFIEEIKTLKGRQEFFVALNSGGALDLETLALIAKDLSDGTIPKPTRKVVQ